jgi:hypothetical protein
VSVGGGTVWKQHEAGRKLAAGKLERVVIRWAGEEFGYADTTSSADKEEVVERGPLYGSDGLVGWLVGWLVYSGVATGRCYDLGYMGDKPT